MNYKITSLSATQSNDTISVSGTAEDGMLAVAISIYDQSGETVLSLETTNVSDDGSFSYEFSLPDGDYLVKAADYDGGEYASFTLSATSESATDSDSSTATKPDTGHMTIEDSSSSAPSPLIPIIGASALALAAIITFIILKHKARHGS